MIMPMSLIETHTSLPHGFQLGNTLFDGATGSTFQLIVTNSGLTQAPASGTLMASVNAANKHIVVVCNGSGTAGSSNLAKCVCVGAPGSGVYFWGQILGYCAKIKVNSGTTTAAGDILVGTVTYSGAVSGVTSGTASVCKRLGTTLQATGAGETTISGILWIGE